MAITSCHVHVLLSGKRDSLKIGGRPSTSRTEVNVERLRQLVCSDGRLTVRMIASQFDLKKDSIWKIIPEELDMRKVCAKMGPRLLKRDHRMYACQDIIERL